MSLARISMPGSNSFQDEFRDDVFNGLSSRHRSIPSKYLYNDAGSVLFEMICETDEYYVMRAEMDILNRNGRDIMERLGSRGALVELGSGSGQKALQLLESSKPGQSYVAVDISPAALRDCVALLRRRRPLVNPIGVVADFFSEDALVEIPRLGPQSMAYLAGSTLGNFSPEEAAKIVSRMLRLAGPRGTALLGLDLVKSVDRLESAYNDRKGLTAAFSLNLLNRVNHELSADFRVADWSHRAVFNAATSAIETDLVSKKDQRVVIDGRLFHFVSGDAIRIEISRKFSPRMIIDLAESCSARVSGAWFDVNNDFCVVALSRQDDGQRP